MISRFLFERISVPDLEKGMDAYSARQKAITNNIANATTPGYKAQRVSFEEEYKKHLDKSELDVEKTDEKHINIGKKDLNDIKPRRYLQEDRRNDSGLNNVDIDHEMAELAKNNIRYEMSTVLVKKRLTALMTSIKGR